jgi:ParB family chromosome partitioning protein
MTIDKYLSYRGDLQAIVGVGADLAFVTLHADRQATGLYRLDIDKLILTKVALPKGGRYVVADEQTLWVGGSDGRVYLCPPTGSPSPRGPLFNDPIVHLALLKNDRLAVLAGMRITILNRADGKTLQTLDLPEVGTCLAAAPTGDWLVAGTERGTVLVFEAESKPEFAPSASDRLHEGAVTALLFEANDLRFLSAGADLKLFSTFARGNLEPDDRGRANNHTEPIAGLAGWIQGRFYSGGRDSTLKSWPPGQGTKPVTHKEGVARVVALTLVTIHTKPHVAIACADNTLRIFSLDDEGKFGELTHRIHDAIATAKNGLAATDATRREAALKTLAEYGDAISLEIIGEQLTSDADHTVRHLAAQLLGASKHPRATILLERGLAETYEAVRTTSFLGLRKQRGDSDLHPIDLALKTEKPDLGKLAVQALEGLAAKDDQALTRLSAAVNAKTFEVRQAALMSLEKAFEPTSPEADLWALGSQHADVRRLALVRLYHRNLLAFPTVQAALRRHSEDADAEVRRMAFLLALSNHEKLLTLLRALDPELHRQLSDLEATAADGTPRKDVEPKPPPALPAAPPTLGDADLEPLLQATASRMLDTCLRGARGLAALRDPRAFGLLLQLSCEEHPPARVEVCWAMAALGDPRVNSRLRSLLQDADASVRDAACTALLRAHANQPLFAADVILNAPYEDVRRRGLQVLLDTIRSPLPLGEGPGVRAAAPGAGSRQLLLRALIDASLHIRRETFKAVHNLTALGKPAEILRFVLQSIHADVRREALTEIMAQVHEPWAWPLLLAFLNDPDQVLRDEALAFGVKKFKEREVEILEDALKSRFADMRLQAIDGLIKKATRPAQALLVQALNDAEATVRLKALQALIDADARTALVDALQSAHADVRIASAVTLAKHGLAIAREPLIVQVQMPIPNEQERQNDWANLVATAALGLGQLGDPSAQFAVVPLLNHGRADLRKAAIQALVGMSQPGATDPLREALQHTDPEVKYRAALGLAYAGDAHAAPVVFSPEAKKLLSPYELLAAACVLKPAGDEQLAAMLDETSDTLRSAPLLVMMLREWVNPGATPERALRCLASRMPRVRLTAARALEYFGQPDEFTKFVVDLFNDRGEQPPWKVSGDVVRAFAGLLTFGSGQAIARTVALFAHLLPKEQSAWDLAWSIHAERFAAEIVSLTPGVSAAGALALTSGPSPRGRGEREVAFGAYVGLVREQGTGAQQANLPAIIRVRQTALGRVVALAAADPGLQAAAQAVCVQALGDPNQPVRLQAFEALPALGMDNAALGAAAIETGHRDLGIKGLELLADGASKAEGEAVLEQVMLTRRDPLAKEAAKLLMTRRPKIAVMQQALGAAHEDLRQEAIAWIAAEYEQSSDAQHALRQALESRYQKVRLVAAITLGMKKDARAFDALVKSLQGPDNVAKQNDIIRALLTLGDPRTPSALLDRLENDPAGTAPVPYLLESIAAFRQPAVVDRLLAYADRLDAHRLVYPVLLTISGHDQPIADWEDENPDKRWEKEQYPRHDAVLARLMEHALRHGRARSLIDWLPAARWARGKEVDPVLALAANHNDEHLRNGVIEVIGWRLRKRNGSPEPLVKGLKHRDPTTQFLAAQMLALARRAEGINVLLSAIEYLENIQRRHQAVYALGQLGDNRAVETLLKIAQEDGHALQATALGAIGHFSQSPQADAIFKLLERKINMPGTDAPLQGLRRFNSRAAWQLIRKQALDPLGDNVTAIELLAHNDEPETRDLLLQILRKPRDEDDLDLALHSARKLWGMESLDPDYAALRSGLSEGIDDPLKRVCDKGDADRIFAILPECHPQVQAELATSLMNRKTLPIAQARAALDHPDAATVRLAAHIVGRVQGEPGASATGANAIEKALQKWHQAWITRRQQMRRANATADGELARISACLQMLVWVAERVEIDSDVLRPMVEVAEDSWYRPVRLAALAALAHGSKPSAAVLATLEAAAVGNDAEARTLAVEALARLSPKRTTELADKILADRVSFRRLANQKDAPIQQTLQAAASQQHYQSVALPHLIARHDRDTLTAVVQNAKLPDATRLGAIEGLAALADEKAEATLVDLGKNEAAPEELRKAAWRAVRRSRRVRNHAV